MAQHKEKEGQGLCPWTKLGPEAPDPVNKSGDREGGYECVVKCSLPPSLSPDLMNRF